MISLIKKYFTKCAAKEKKDMDKFYAENYPKILKKGKVRYRIRSIIIYTLIFAVLGGILDIYFNFTLPIPDLSIHEIKNIVYPKAAIGFIMGLIITEVEWASWENGYDEYLNKKKTD